MKLPSDQDPALVLVDAVLRDLAVRSADVCRSEA
jgi:hypothetical protein